MVGSHFADGPYAYHLLRVALEHRGCSPAQLHGQEEAAVRRLACRSLEIESLVLDSSEAREVRVRFAEVEAAYREIARRYTDDAELVSDLERNGLDEQSLRESLERDLRFHAVMRRIGAEGPLPDEEELETFYRENRERFVCVERRRARHLLITINADYPENEPAVARSRIEALAAVLRIDPERFGELARHHSECPTALQDGDLGLVRRGQLYPELDRALFGLGAGGMSQIVESEVGLHLVRCESIHAARSVPLAEIRDDLRLELEQRGQRARQVEWLRALQRGRKGSCGE